MRRVLVLLPFLMFFQVPGLFAEDGRISQLTVSFKEDDILVSARLERGFHENFKRDIHNGIPKDLFYYVLLKRKQTFWIDEEVLSKTIKHTVKFDILKKQYLITTRIGTRFSETRTDTYEKMLGLISEINRVKIAPTQILKPEDTYYLSIKAEMRATKLPFYLEYVLFFIPFLELNTPWADSSPFYARS